MTSPKAYIKAIATHLPEQRLTNEQLAEDFPDWSPEKIYAKTGIKVRAIAAPNECASDLAYKAAQRLFASGKCSPNEVEFLLFCTQSPDYYLPTTACVLQERLGLKQNVGALDFNLGCSGFVQGLSLAKGLIESGQARNVLLITAETYSKYMHPKDKSARTIFSDGAAATFIDSTTVGEEAIGPFVFGTDGKGANNLIVRAGCHRLPKNDTTAIEHTDASGNVRSENNLYMNGAEIFNFTLESVHRTIHELLERAAMRFDDVDYFVFHQANRFMLEHLRRKSKIPESKFCINMEEYGNTVSSTIPMAIEIAIRDGHVKTNDRIMIVGFGVGYSWSAAMIKLTL